MNDGLELRAARTLYVRANRLRNESMAARSRRDASRAAIRFLLGVRHIAATVNKPVGPFVMRALMYLEEVTTPLFAFECNVRARAYLAHSRGESL